MRRPDELRAAVEEHLETLAFWDQMGELEEPMRYALKGGGKRIRPVLCIATTEAAGGNPNDALDAAAAIELVHSFSLVHDDLPALDDDAERRGRPTVHVRFGEAQAVLAGDALLTEALRLTLSYPTTDVAKELAIAVSLMIRGQYLDVEGFTGDLAELYSFKTGALFLASVRCGLWVAGMRPETEEARWLDFGDAYGYAFQVVDDLLDGDGLARKLGAERTRALARETADLARARLLEIPADTSVLNQLVDELVSRVRQA